MQKRVLTLLLAAAGFAALAQPQAGGSKAQNWLQEKPFQQNFFIENKGQFAATANGDQKANVLFGADAGYQALFTRNGVIYRVTLLEEMTRQEERAFEEAMEKSGHREEEEEENERVKKMPHAYEAQMEWVGANENAQVITEDASSSYWNYLDPADRTKSIEHARGFKKIIYKELYPGIDVIYTFHPAGGLKYDLVIHPGADASQIKMQYTGAKKMMLDAKGDLSFMLCPVNITDHAPQTFYEEGGVAVPSAFKLKDNAVTFELGQYDQTKTIVIDPWTNSSLNPGVTVVELNTDAANNVYIYGFTGQINTSSAANQYVQKYNAAGSLLWTFTFPSSTNFLQNTGDITVDLAGNAYVTCGFYMIGYFIADCAKAKLDPNGSLLWNSVSPLLYENWRIAFNCDHSQLIQFGCGPACCNVGSGDIINTATGAETNKFSPPATGDIVTATYGRNGNLYFISVADTSPSPNSHLSCLNPSTNFSTVFSIPFPVNAAFKDGFNTSYGTYGFNGIAASCNYLYVCLGATLQKRDLSNGALLGSVAVPGGVQHGNSGLAVDKCGNVYVGSSTGVYVFDQNLSSIANFATPQRVLDIAMGSNGTFYACGGSWTTSSNQGFLAQFSLSTLCTPVTTTFTPSSCSSGNTGTATALPVFCAAPYSYAWSTNPVQTTQTATGLASGTYTVIVTGAGVCNEIDTAFVTIPAGNGPIPTASNNGPVCANQSLQLSATGGNSYSWSGPGGFSSSQQNPTITQVTTAGSGVYTVTVISTGNCSATATTNVVVHALPAVNAGGMTTCVGGNIQLSASGGITYSWSGPDGFTSGQQNPSIANATNSMSGIYQVTVTDSNGCANSGIAQVTVTPPLQVIASCNSPVCIGSTLNLYCNTGGNVLWNGPGGFTSSQQNPVVNNVQAGAAGIYTVTVTNAGGCSGSDTTSVVVNPIPTSVTPLSAAGCAPVCVNFANTSTVSGTCEWNFGDGTTSANCNPTHCFTSEGIFNATFTLTDQNGCKGTSVSTIHVYPVPHADFNANPQPASILEPEIHFSNTSSGGVIGSYNWSFGDQHNSNQANPVHTYDEAGNYPVQLIVTTDHGCVDTIIKIIVVEDDFEIYVPNAFTPNSDGSNDVFMAKGVGIETYTLLIFDRWGNQVFVSHNLEKGWDGTLHGEDVQEDVYAWKIEVTHSKGMKKELSGTVSLLR